MNEKVIRILAEFTDLPIESIHENSRLVGDLGLTSLDIVGVISRMEEELDINVDENLIEDFQTVNDVIQYVTVAASASTENKE